MFQVLLCQGRDKKNQEETKQTQRRERENEKILTQSQEQSSRRGCWGRSKNRKKGNLPSISPSEVWRRKLNCCCCYPTRDNRFTWNPNKYIILKTHTDFASTACNSHVSLHFAATHEEQRITIATMITRASFMHPQTFGRFREMKLGLAITKHPKRGGFLWG
jgi:hypothetical protein